MIRTRTHAKALIRPALVLIILGAAVGAGAALVPDELRPVGPAVVAVLGLVLAIWWVLLPFLRWWTTTYTITNRRLITRAGILNKVGKDLPLNRVHEVSYRTQPDRPDARLRHPERADRRRGRLDGALRRARRGAGAREMTELLLG